MGMNEDLYNAAERGDTAGVDAALSKGADVHWKNPYEYGK